MSAGFALGPNSKAQGGPLSRTGDIQPMQQKQTKGDNFFNDGMLSGINPLYAVGAAAAVGVVYYFVKKKKGK